MITSEWGTPNMFEDGLNPELLLGGKYGHQIHVWDLQKRKHKQVLDLGAEQQLVFELRPARNPTNAYGFVGVVISLKDLSSSIWLWYKDGRGENAEWKIRKVIEIPAEPADPELLPPMLKGFGAVPPFITDINLSLDDKYLYVSCWGSGEFRQYDVSDPFHPKLNSTVRIGGIVRRAAHPSNPETPLNGGPQMVEVSRDGRRVYVTNSLYTAVDDQFYPDGIKGWMMKVDVDPDHRRDARRSAILPALRRHAAAPDPAGGRRRFLRLVLLRIRSHDHGNDIYFVAHFGGIGGLSRPQSRDGLAIRGRARHAGEASAPRCGGLSFRSRSGTCWRLQRPSAWR